MVIIVDQCDSPFLMVESLDVSPNGEPSHAGCHVLFSHCDLRRLVSWRECGHPLGAPGYRGDDGDEHPEPDTLW